MEMVDDRLYYNMLAKRAVTDEAAFDELYEHFFPRVYNFIFARLKRTEDADDVTSVTFMKMNSHLAEYDSGKAAFSTWLFRIATNAVTDYVRRRGRLAEAEWEDFFQPAAPEREEPEAKALMKEQKSELLLAIDGLSEREQKIVALRYWMGMGSNEIAENLGMTSGNVRTTLHRALEKLRKVLAEKN